MYKKYIFLCKNTFFYVKINFFLINTFLLQIAQYPLTPLHNYTSGD
jgi:hypothetical protein